LQLFQQYDIQLRTSCESCSAHSSSTNQWYAYNPTNLVQMIMSGNQNQNILANAHAQHLAAVHAQAIANGLATHPPANGHIIYQSRLCTDCWLYWKKFGSFKFARPNRQIHKCSVNGCGREFKLKQALVKHCGVAHGYFPKPAVSNTAGQTNNQRTSMMRNRTSFYLYTTPMTHAARLVCTGAIKLKRLARKPFKAVDLTELNREWQKDSRRSITQLYEQSKNKAKKIRRLTVELISVISKCRIRKVNKLKNIESIKKLSNENKSKEPLVNGNSNGHPGEHMNEDDEARASDEEENLVIEEPTEKPEFLKYFDKKCSSPSHVPERIIFPRPSQGRLFYKSLQHVCIFNLKIKNFFHLEQLNKFHLNLISQTRKRTHEQSSGISDSLNTSSSANLRSSSLNQNGDNSISNDSSPQSKRTLLSSNSNNQQSISGSNKLINQRNNNQVNTNKPNTLSASSTNLNTPNKQQMRMPQKSIKPIQSINLLNAPEEIYYQAVQEFQ
jgi:hypothetical protein